MSANAVKVSDDSNDDGGGPLRLLLLILLVARVPICMILCIIENIAYKRQYQGFLGDRLGLNEINISYQREKVSHHF